MGVVLVSVREALAEVGGVSRKTAPSLTARIPLPAPLLQTIVEYTLVPWETEKSLLLPDSPVVSVNG